MEIVFFARYVPKGSNREMSDTVGISVVGGSMKSTQDVMTQVADFLQQIIIEVCVTDNFFFTSWFS